MLILALTRKGQESFNGQVPKDEETAPVSSSSTPASSSSSAPAPSSSSIASSSSTPASSSSETTGIRAIRTTPTVAKEHRSIVNAKGAKVSPNGHKRYRVNFEY